jgi:hypothetical protein
MRRLSIAACGLSLLLLAPALAAAGPPSAADREAARSLADKGADLFDAGQYEASIEYFRKADEKVHAPTFVLAIGQAYAKSGKLIEARAHYQKVVGEKLPPSPPASFVGAQATARRELDDLSRRIPTLQIVLSGPDAGRAKVAIDGAEVPSIDQPLEQNPGDHRIEVTTGAGQPVSRSVTLREGAAERVVIELSRPGGEKAGGSKGSLVPAAIALGVGAAGIGVGAVTGSMALGRVGDIKAACSGNVCPSRLAGDAGSAGTLADISTATFIVGGVGVAAGVVLLILRPGGGSEEASAGASGRPPTARRAPPVTDINASFGLGSVRVSGRF